MSSSGGGRRSVATTKNTRQEASKVRGQSAQSVTQEATISCHWGRSGVFTTENISEVRGDTVERPPLRAVGSVVKLSRYYDLKKKRRTSTGVISQVTKDALTADNSQRTASMGVISIGRDGKKHKKQRKKHGLLISRTRARAAADKRAYRFGQSRKKNDISSLQQTTPTLQNTCYLDLDETDLQSHQKGKRHVTSCAPYWPRRAHRGRPSVAHMPSFSHQVCALPSAHALAKHNHTHRISVFILAAFTS